MFLFIGGLQPRTRKIDGGPPRACPSCARPALELRRTDQYLSLFFIPLFPVKRGRPYLVCTACGAVADPRGQRTSPGTASDPRACRSCGRPARGDFLYCPYCGRPLKDSLPA